MRNLFLLILLCGQIDTNSSTEYIPCGPTRCYNVGYEVCIGPPEVRTEADSDCYSCEVLARVGDPCDPASKRQGCIKYCTDKALEEQQKKWNKSQEFETQKRHELIMQQTRALEHERKQEANKTTLIGLIGLPSLAALVVVSFVVFCVHRQYKRNRDHTGEESGTSCSTPLVSETKPEGKPYPENIDLLLIKETDHAPQPFNDSNDTEARSQPICDSTATSVYNADASDGCANLATPRLHERKCHDERLCCVPPQQDDDGRLCPTSSFCN